MTEDDARRLGQRFIDTWPTGPRAYIWRDLFGELDIDLARAAYYRLEHDIERGAPTPGQFHAAYRAARASAKAVTNDDPPDTCQICDGTGWRDAPPIVTQANGQPVTYTQVQPCDCSTGQRMRPVHATILEQNRRP